MLTLLCLVTGAVISWILVKVLRLTKFSQEPTFVLMLICLILALLANLAFFELRAADLVRDNGFSRKYYCGQATINFLAPLFLAYAAILNTNKWIYFNWHIVKLNQQSSNDAF